MMLSHLVVVFMQVLLVGSFPGLALLATVLAHLAVVTMTENHLCITEKRAPSIVLNKCSNIGDQICGLILF